MHDWKYEEIATGWLCSPSHTAILQHKAIRMKSLIYIVEKVVVFD
jgi:hypothetical protein